MNTTPGYSEDKQQLLARLRRIEGQVRGHCVAGAAASGDQDHTEHLVHEASKPSKRLLRS